jgi:hypothetical protein
MEDLNLYQNLYNENYTDARKNDLIQKVFENKEKKLLSQRSEAIKMAKGGAVEEDRTYTPYEFLHELLPKVYDRPYIVDDATGRMYDEAIANEQKNLDEYIYTKLQEYGVNSIYKIDNKVLIEEIEIRRRKLISDKAFITQSELEAYLFCHPELVSEHYVKKLPVFDIDDLRSKGLVMVDYDTANNSYQYVYVYEYLSGDIFTKRSRLIQYKDKLIDELKVLSVEQHKMQEDALLNSLPIQAKITKDIDSCIFILPKSNFGERFMISPEDVMDIKMYGSRSFIETFKSWASKDGGLDKAVIKHSTSIDAIHKYFTDMTAKSKNDNDSVYADLRKRAYLDGKVILFEFLTKGLTTKCQNRLEIEWNTKYNNYAEPKYYKIPVACHLSNKFKNGRVFTPNETQIQSIQYMKSVGSGLLAYGVGVGKTASAIMNVSYALDNKLCKKPLFIVPNATYSKWKMEMFGGVKTIYEVNYLEDNTASSLTFEEESKAKKFAKSVNGKLVEKAETIYGHISHQKNVVDLYNLNESKVREIKTYTESEEKQFTTITSLLDYLKDIPKDYEFDDSNINQNIRDKYDDFEADNLISEYRKLVNNEFYDWWNNKKVKTEFDYDSSIAMEHFKQNVFTLTIKEYFEKSIRVYRQELAYILGTLNEFEDGTIFIATYEALEHLGLVMQDNSELRDDDSVFGMLFKEISQGDSISEANYNVSKNLAVLWRDAIYGKIKTKLDISSLGLDYVVFDESHLLKKVIVDCKGIPTWRTRGGSGTSIRESRKYGFGEGEFPSTLALVGYFITRYIQMNNDNKNVIHLTATPFTNKPAEIYSMMSLTNRQMLENSNLDYMEQFFDNFMDISFELIFGNTGVARKEALLGYRNLPQLRNLIYSMMDYKSGEDANIKRPEKILFPSVEEGRETTIPESGVQDDLFRQIKNYQRGRIEYNELCADAVQEVDVENMTEDELLDYLNDNGSDSQKEKYEALEKPLEDDEFDKLKEVVKKLIDKKVELKEGDITDEKEKDAFRVVKGLTLLKAVTLSPFLSMCQKELGIEPTYRQFIDSSPKLIYTIKCIKSIHDYELQNNLPKSGIVIYMNGGVNVSFKTADKKTIKWKDGGLEKIKQYLISVMGYSEEEVSIVKGGMSNADKERNKNKFLSGKSTILIGSSSISTGVDLQNNASALFLCTFDWNPTDNEQISGRIHRQGNRFAKVRIVYPMVMNSADPNIFQQLYEKTLRIKNIWDRNDTGNTLDLKDFDVNSLRKGILDEPEDLAVYWKEEQNDELKTLENTLITRLDDLRTASSDKGILDNFTPIMKGLIVIIDAYKKEKTKQEAKRKLAEKIGDAEEEYKDKLDELRLKLDNDEIEGDKYKEEKKKATEKFEKVKEKFKDDVYDFDKDPEGRYIYLTYDEIGEDADLFKKVNSFLIGSDSKLNSLSYDERTDIYYNWLKEKFPRYANGKYNLAKEENEDSSYYIDFRNIQQIESFANKWKGAYRGFGKIKENLAILGVTFDEITEASELINQQLEDIKQKQEEIKQQFPNKIQEFILAKEQRIVVQKSIDERVEEFAKYNKILKEVVTTFKEDKAKYVEVTKVKETDKPKKEIEKVIEEATIIEEQEIEETIDTSNLIENLKNGLVVRFNFGLNKKGNTKVADIFYEEGNFISYVAFENVNGDVVSDDEEIFTEQQVIDYYIKHNDKISEEFYDDGDEEEDYDEEVVIQKPVEAEQPVSTKSKKQLYSELIEGYELALEIESDENKKQFYKDVIEGYEIALELEN